MSSDSEKNIKNSEKDILKKILRGKNKRIVFYLISKKENFMAKDLVPYISYRSHLTRTLKELEQMGLIVCKNKEDINYKMYETTNLTLKLKEDFQKYYDKKRDFENN